MKIRKGQYGYRDQHKKSRALLTGLFAVAIIAQLIRSIYQIWMRSA